MITIVIPTLNDERALVPALAALVPGAAAGLVREVILADGGSADETAKVADVAGCDFLRGPADPGARLRMAAQRARGSWLMFLAPSVVLQEGWMSEVPAFVEKAERVRAAENHAAAFRLVFDGFGIRPRFAEFSVAVRYAFTGRPRVEQGLLIAKRFYDRLGGHRDGEDAQLDLLVRIGRRRIVALRSAIVLGGTP
jgi:glycosyltransferase involved in cell wall biosynthesis